MSNDTKNKEMTTLPFEIKSVSIKESDDGIVTIEGHAAAFNNVDSYDDKIIPGAFAKWIKNGNTSIPILLDHNASMQTTAGYNVSAVEDKHGLFVTGEINTNTEAGKTAHENIKHAMKVGKTIGLSIGYFPTVREFVDDVRVLKEIDVVEYSLTNFPANEKAGVTSIKSLIEDGNSEAIAERKRFIENLLRDEAGCSIKTARSAVSMIFANSDEDVLEEIKNDEPEVTTDVVDEPEANTDVGENEEVINLLQNLINKL